MVFRVGWLSTGRDEAAGELLKIVVEHISKGIIPAEIRYVFCNREKGESPESDRFIEFAKALGIPVILLSSRDFLPSLREKDKETWRISFHQEVTNRIKGYPVDTIVLAGYMLIMSQLFCETHPMINLHPAEPKGPKGTWQEVIWQLIEKRATRTGVMMHVVTKDLDEGPPITFVNFPIQGPGFDSLWKDFDEKLKHCSFQELVKEEGEENPLFKEIRKQGVRRELPLIVMTLKTLAGKKVRIEKGKILDERGNESEGICLNKEVEEYLKEN
ncbi:MAG: formyltransferase family protein [Thermodesulfobacteriota bacterium]